MVFGMKKIPVPVGSQFGRWTVIGESVLKNRSSYYPCRCACGTERSVRRSALLHGYSISCGCVPVSKQRERRLLQGAVCEAIQSSSADTSGGI